MSLNAIRNQIVATLNAVDGIGKVHRYQRYGKNNRDLKAFYVTGDQLLGWYVSRKVTQELEFDHTQNTEAVTWEIVGFMGLDDEAESEAAFDTLIEAARAAFRNNQTLNSTVDTNRHNGRAGLQVDDVGPVMFAGVLCHMARCSLVTIGNAAMGDTPADAFAHMHADWDVAPFGNVTGPLPADTADMQSDQEIETEED